MDGEGSGSIKRKTRMAQVLPHARQSTSPQFVLLERMELFVLGGPDRGAHLALKSPQVTVGYGPGNDIRLRDESVSDQHLMLTETPTGVMVKDMGSTNGTRLNDVPVVEALVKPGSDITLGDTVVRFQPKRED